MKSIEQIDDLEQLSQSDRPAKMEIQIRTDTNLPIEIVTNLPIEIDTNLPTEIDN
jgi:hypothetical protein